MPKIPLIIIHMKSTPLLDYIISKRNLQHNKTNLLSFMGVKNMKKEDKDKVINALSECSAGGRQDFVSI